MGRRKQQVATERAGMAKLPDLKDAEAVQKFFLEEIQLGEELLAQERLDHLTNAIAVCGQPQQLLQVLQQTLPPPVFQMLLTKLPSISQRIVSAQRDYEKGVDHLTNAIAVCGQPQQLLQVLQQTLPPPVFQMLLTKLPSISQVAHLLQNKIKLLLLHQVIILKE
ncbi:hypothetical protein F7725_006004 [Dissostichus mawsoni]|uniref:Uncharacterized protein n=1 Tax=Dissostichus mawsoni TaxID=36200 RepID=A0A7J5YV77_DISMA|nr:hypothetical protein F7725_006004 [Dissostichus mawsoni]